MKSTCWDTRATDSIIKCGQKDTEASIADNTRNKQMPNSSCFQARYSVKYSVLGIGFFTYFDKHVFDDI